jgi:hypothetical protein
MDADGTKSATPRQPTNSAVAPVSCAFEKGKRVVPSRIECAVEAALHDLRGRYVRCTTTEIYNETPHDPAARQMSDAADGQTGQTGQTGKRSSPADQHRPTTASPTFRGDALVHNGQTSRRRHGCLTKRDEG